MWFDGYCPLIRITKLSSNRILISRYGQTSTDTKIYLPHRGFKKHALNLSSSYIKPIISSNIR